MADTVSEAPPEAVICAFRTPIANRKDRPKIVSNWRHSQVGTATWKVGYMLFRKVQSEDMEPQQLRDSQMFWAVDMLQQMYNFQETSAFDTPLLEDPTYSSWEERERHRNEFPTFLRPSTYRGWIAMVQQEVYVKLKEHSLHRALEIVNVAYEWNWDGKMLRWFEEKPSFVGRQDTIWEWADAYVWKSDDDGDTSNDERDHQLFRRFENVGEVNMFVQKVEAHLKPLQDFIADADLPYMQKDLVHINVFEKTLCRHDSLHEHLLTGFFDPSTWHWRPNLYAQAMVVVDVLLADTMRAKDDEEKFVKLFLYKTFREPREHEDAEEAKDKSGEQFLKTDTQHCYSPLLCTQFLLRALLFRVLTEEKYSPSVEPESVLRKYQRTIAVIEPILHT